jgi:hypothetical protein
MLSRSQTCSWGSPALQGLRGKLVVLTTMAEHYLKTTV